MLRRFPRSPTVGGATAISTAQSGAWKLRAGGTWEAEAGLRMGSGRIGWPLVGGWPFLTGCPWGKDALARQLGRGQELEEALRALRATGRRAGWGVQNVGLLPSASASPIHFLC